MRHSLVALLLASLAAPAAAAGPQPPPRLEIREPRAYGHVLGDVLERRIEIEVAAGSRLVETSLPKPGRAGRWLELRPPQVSHDAGVGAGRYRIALAYQIVNAPQEVVTLALPELTLEFMTGSTASRRSVPEWPFTVGPLTPPVILARGPLDEMQPDAPPQAVDTGAVESRLAVYAAAGGALALFLAYRLWGVPFIARTRGPFARAHRDLKILARRKDGDAARNALRRFHRALDESAGRALFGGELRAFLARKPQFAQLEAELQEFFAVSRREFFGAGAEESRLLPWLEALCRRCRDVERGSA